MEVETQPLLDSFSHADDVHLLVRDVTELLQELLAMLERAQAMNASKQWQPLLARLAIFSQTLMPVMEHLALAQIDLEQLQHQLYLKMKQCEQQIIEISALQTRLTVKDKQCRGLEVENQALQQELQSVLGSLQSTFGS